MTRDRVTGLAALLLGTMVAIGTYQLPKSLMAGDIGPKVFHRDYKLIKRSHLQKTREFYEKHGGKTIIMARFIPIIRTFAPFVAGIGAMKYSRFIVFNIVGALLWVGIFLALGFKFGELPIVKKNFSLVVLAIIFLSLLPPVIEYIKSTYKKVPAVKE